MLTGPRQTCKIPRRKSCPQKALRRKPQIPIVHSAATNSRNASGRRLACWIVTLDAPLLKTDHCRRRNRRSVRVMTLRAAHAVPAGRRVAQWNRRFFIQRKWVERDLNFSRTEIRTKIRRHRQHWRTMGRFLANRSLNEHPHSRIAAARHRRMHGHQSSQGRRQNNSQRHGRRELPNIEILAAAKGLAR